MKVQVEREEVINWLKAGRCPGCGFTFKSCTCGPMVRMLLYICIERDEEISVLKGELRAIEDGTGITNVQAQHESQIAELNRRAEAEVAALRERERWIPVEEKLPEDNGEYTAYSTPNGVVVSRWWAEDKVWRYPQVTHWKALSAAPERGKDGI